MWQTLVNRRELVDLILNGQQSFGNTAVEEGIFSLLPQARRTVVLSWKEAPILAGAMPIAIVLQDDEREDFLAAINSTTGAASPFSAFCRIISTSEAKLYSQARFNDGSREVLEALVGLAYGEAIAHANSSIRSAELSPAICRRTVAYAWTKALSNRVPVEQLDKLVDAWFEALSLSGGNERLEHMRRTVAAEISILRIAANIYYGIPNSSPMGLLCQAMIDGDEASLHRYWASLSSLLPERASLSDIANSNREERGAYFQAALRHFAESDASSDLGPGICAFLASRISPASFEHLDMLATRSDPRLSLWYSFLAALQKPRGSLGFAGGLGSRLLRDVDMHESFETRPVGDIALSELRVLARGGLDGISKRLGHSNEIEIEIVPLVTCSFRFQIRASKQTDFFDTTSKVPVPPATKEPEMPTHRIQAIIESLQELAKVVHDMPALGDQKIGAKKARKKY